MALSHELANSFHTKPTSLYDTTVARLHMHREGYGMAKECLQKAIVKDIQDSTAWGLLGHAHYLMGEYSSAKDVYQRTLCFVNRPAHAHLVYTRLADVFFKEQNVTITIITINKNFPLTIYGSPTKGCHGDIGLDQPIIIIITLRLL